MTPKLKKIEIEHFKVLEVRISLYEKPDEQGFSYLVGVCLIFVCLFFTGISAIICDKTHQQSVRSATEPKETEALHISVPGFDWTGVAPLCYKIRNPLTKFMKEFLQGSVFNLLQHGFWVAREAQNGKKRHLYKSLNYIN